MRWPSHVTALEPQRGENFLGPPVFLFASGLSNCCPRDLWPSKFIDRGISGIKICFKDGYTSVFSNCGWPLNTEISVMDPPPPSPHAVKNLHITYRSPETLLTARRWLKPYWLCKQLMNAYLAHVLCPVFLQSNKVKKNITKIIRNIHLPYSTGLIKKKNLRTCGPAQFKLVLKGHL